MALGFIEIFLSPHDYKIQELVNTLKAHDYELVREADSILMLSNGQINELTTIEELELFLFKNKEIFIRFIKYSDSGNLNFSLMVNVHAAMIQEDFTLDQFRIEDDALELKNILLDRSRKQMESGLFLGFIYDLQGALEDVNWIDFIKNESPVDMGEYEQYSLAFPRDKFNTISHTREPILDSNYLKYRIMEWE